MAMPDRLAEVSPPHEEGADPVPPPSPRRGAGFYLHRYALIPAYERLRGRRTTAYLRRLERTQWLGRDELEALQLDALRRLLAHAARHCPYYRERWAALGLDHQRVRSLDDLRHWPITRREEIRAHRLAMRSDVPGTRLVEWTTSGSTGAVLHFDVDQDGLAHRLAAMHRGYAWAGGGLGSRHLLLWAPDVERNPLARRTKDALYHWLFRRCKQVNPYNLRPREAHTLVREFSDCRADVIVAFANPLHAVAQAFEAAGVSPRPPRGIIVGGEKLYGFQRALIERVFRAPVFATYGGREPLLIGAECEQRRGFHLTMEHLVVEVVDDDGRPAPAGAEGEVVFTDLYSYGMPFVRYAIGDRATAGWGECPCGRGLALLRGVVGRRLDLVVTPDGRKIAGIVFPHFLKQFEAVRQFQVVQDCADAVELRLALARPLSPQERRRLEGGVRSVLGPSLALRVVEVDEIPFTAAGKLHVVTNPWLAEQERRAREEAEERPPGEEPAAPARRR